MMLEMVHNRTATGVTTAALTAAVLRSGKQMRKLPRYYFSCKASFKKDKDKLLRKDRRNDKSEGNTRKKT
jgi:hypothetical protein